MFAYNFEYEQKAAILTIFLGNNVNDIFLYKTSICSTRMK